MPQISTFCQVYYAKICFVYISHTQWDSVFIGFSNEIKREIRNILPQHEE